MKQSLFRINEIFEALGVFLFCFISNIILSFLKKKYHGKTSLIAYFINSFAEYRLIISVILTLLIVVFIYQFISKKRKEIKIRFMVGETLLHLKINYFIQITISLMLSYLLSVLLALYLKINPMVNLYLLLIILLYCFISMIWVRIY